MTLLIDRLLTSRARRSTTQAFTWGLKPLLGSLVSVMSFPQKQGGMFSILSVGKVFIVDLELDVVIVLEGSDESVVGADSEDLSTVVPLRRIPISRKHFPVYYLCILT